MKILRTVAALAFLLACTPAFAQWQTPNHSVPIGKASVSRGRLRQRRALLGSRWSARPFSRPRFRHDRQYWIRGRFGGYVQGQSKWHVCCGHPQGAVYGCQSSASGTPLASARVAEISLYRLVSTCQSILALSVPASSGGALVINLTQANGSAPKQYQSGFSALPVYCAGDGHGDVEHNFGSAIYHHPFRRDASYFKWRSFSHLDFLKTTTAAPPNLA